MKNDRMNPSPARLQIRSEAPSARALLLAVAGAVLALWTLLQLLPADPAPAQKADQTLQEPAPAA